MKKLFQITIYLFSLVLASFGLTAQESPNVIQEEESSEVFLEEYTDEFQEKFFEALKQKGIQNYDRAINLLLECLRLDSNTIAVDHELAKTYLLDKKYVSAQSYAEQAVKGKPESFWFLHTLITILEEQGKSFETIKENIPFENESLQKNLAIIYYQKKKYSSAELVLKELPDSEFKKNLQQKITDSLAAPNLQPKEPITTAKLSQEKQGDSKLERYIDSLNLLLGKEDYTRSAELAMEAIESFPVQPYFYYVHGLAVQRLGNSKDAVSILEMGLDFLFDDDSLLSKFYTELANAHSALGNMSKANMYLSKIKTGL